MLTYLCPSVSLIHSRRFRNKCSHFYNIVLHQSDQPLQFYESTLIKYLIIHNARRVSLAGCVFDARIKTTGSCSGRDS